MKVVQVTPGILPIPPNGWGAVEKIIWEYKLCLDKLGWETEILYTDQVVHKEDQIVHVHMANLANILHQRGIPYVFSLHDHHVEYFTKDSEVYRENYSAIKNSTLTFVHSVHLIDYFDGMKNIVYLSHGVNLGDYIFQDRTKSLYRDGHKLLMMANNGLGGDPLIDRKGFLYGIECARTLNIPLDIMCPSSNKHFFDFHKPDLKNINILYDVDYKSSIENMYHYTIFLNPSRLEAGHPNLTILESLSTGMPVVATCNVDLPGLIKCQPSVDSLTESVDYCISSYYSQVGKIERDRTSLSWDLVVSKMVQNYKKYFGISQKTQLEHSYLSTVLEHKIKLSQPRARVKFTCGRPFCKLYESTDASIIFKDKRTNKIHFHTLTQKGYGVWMEYHDPNIFCDWLVEIKIGSEIIFSEDFNMKNKKVLLDVEDQNIDQDILKKFVEKTGCLLTVKTKYKIVHEGIQNDILAQDEDFYTTLNLPQLLDYFVDKDQLPDKELIIANSNALGDKIVSVSYAHKYAETKGKILDLMVNGADIFDSKDYPNLRILERKDIDFDYYTELIFLDYKFDKPVQRGFSDQLGLEWKEIRPKIKKSTKSSPFKSKYVCFGVQSTAQCKYWNYPGGWETLAKEFRKIGLTPVSVDKWESFGIDGWWNILPPSSVKKVGLDFNDVVNIIQHCEFFIGVSSGLSWVAHALGKKVVLISGVTSLDNEFTQDVIRINNTSVCNSCFTKKNDWDFDGSDWLWCPVNKNTEKWFECTRTITPKMVMDRIKQGRLIEI
jgi:autotransporter strand-loop-strand O-heptosyltransferase